eukprot:10136279-Lingulodinium_polyedra.AAC.1
MACIGVLHALDLGFTKDLMGNLFWEFPQHGLRDGSNHRNQAASPLAGTRNPLPSLLAPKIDSTH